MNCFKRSGKLGKQHGLLAIRSCGNHSNLRTAFALLEAQIILSGLRQLFELCDSLGGSSPTLKPGVDRPDAVEAEDIDATDILRATLRAMTEAVRQLAPPPDLVLVDGNVRPHLPMPARAVIQGDLRVPAISAASILAKVTRDRLMEGWALRFPAYGFAQHKGYGTVAHRDAILRYGLSPIHRRTFAGIKEYVEDTGTQAWLW